MYLSGDRQEWQFAPWAICGSGCTVRKVVALLSREVAAESGRLQVIVLDHAGDDVWGGLPNLDLIEEWGERLGGNLTKGCFP